MLHYSRYNYITELEPGKKWGLLNLQNLVGFKLNRLTKLLYDNILKAPDNRLAKVLKAQGFLVDYDELAHYRAMHAAVTTNSQHLALTICTTLGCNFRCPYCFEEHGQRPVSEEVQEAIVKMVKDYFDEFNPKSFHVTWFGGEPLLYPEVIQRLSGVFIELCEQYKVKYDASVFTNCYLLTPELATMLESCQVQGIFTTLDGMQAINDKTRVLADGRGTFEHIVGNLRQLKTTMKIIVRSNLSSVNKDDFPKLQRFMQELEAETGNSIRVYGAYMRNYENTPDEVSATVLDYGSFLEEEVIGNGRKYATLKPCEYNFCGITAFSSFTVDDKGDLYKCWNHVGRQEYSVGNVLEEGKPWLEQTKTRCGAEYLGFDVTRYPECAECILLPQCNGGCLDERFRMQDGKYCKKPMLKVLDELVKRRFAEAEDVLNSNLR